MFIAAIFIIHTGNSLGSPSIDEYISELQYIHIQWTTIQKLNGMNY